MATSPTDRPSWDPDDDPRIRRAEDDREDPILIEEATRRAELAYELWLDHIGGSQ